MSFCTEQSVPLEPYDSRREDWLPSRAQARMLAQMTELVDEKDQKAREKFEAFLTAYEASARGLAAYQAIMNGRNVREVFALVNRQSEWINRLVSCLFFLCGVTVTAITVKVLLGIV